jgi:predicted DNA-binding transcriptional regulator YafY
MAMPLGRSMSRRPVSPREGSSPSTLSRREGSSPSTLSAQVTSGPPSSRNSGRPPGKFTQHKRMHQLRQLLVEHPKGVTLAEIAAHLDVTTRSARRYLREAQGRRSFDLELESIIHAGEKRWRIPAVDVPRRVEVRRTQAYALLAARPLFDTMRGSTVYEEIDLAAESLIGVARRPGRGPNAGMQAIELERRFRYVPFAPKDYSVRSEDLDTLFHAVADLQPVSLRYPDDGDGYATLTIHPYALVLYKEAIYVLGRDVARGEVRTFELDGVRDAQCLDAAQFELPGDFSVDDYAQGQFGLWCAKGATTRVVIDFDDAAAPQLVTRRFHPSQQIAPLDGGGVRMELALGNLDELASWVMGFGPLAIVREPSTLRDRVERSLTAALDRYRAGSKS